MTFPIVFETEESGAVSAYVPGLPVYAAADTQRAAERAIEDVLAAYLDAHPERTESARAAVRVARVHRYARRPMSLSIVGPAAQVITTNDVSNRLADAYSTASEQIEDRQRLWETEGKAAGADQLEIDVTEEGIENAVLAFNWSNPADRLAVDIERCEESLVVYRGSAELDGRPVGALERCVGPMLAMELFDDPAVVRRHYERLCAGGRLRARAVYGFWPATGEGEDMVLYADETRRAEVARFPMLRQQQRKTDASPYLSLADFVAPREAGVADHVGAFAVTAGIGLDALVREFEREHDDYQAILAKALADRLAEAGAEWLHQRARREWYAPGEALAGERLVAEEYRGIRPAFGYPACPDHSEKRTLWRLLGAERAGITLTESFAMLPAASVSGLYFGHPEARYFALGRIGRDQAEDYARRKGAPLAEVERWLGPSLGYEPAGGVSGCGQRDRLS